MPDPPPEADAVVIGAGIVGASCAFHLAQQGLRVCVLEARAGAAEGSTGRSFASVRAQWSDPLNIELSWRSIRAYRDFEQVHGIDIGYRPTGYLFLVPTERWEAQLAAVAMQREHGVPVSVLGLDDAQRHTSFAVQGLGGATWGEADGVVDPHGVAVAYLDLAEARGAVVRYRQPVVAIDRSSDHWSVACAGAVVRAPFVVNAAGGWGRDVAALAGLDVPVDHSRRTIFSSAPVPEQPAMPMTIDIGTGFYLRSEGDRVLFARTRPDEPLGYVDTVDWAWLEPVMRIGTSRFPWLADLPLDRSAAWAGTYEITADDLPILGRNPTAPGWVDACGFSGHGVIQAPEAGRLVAEEIVDGRARSVDIDPLRIGRFAGDTEPVHRDLVF